MWSAPGFGHPAKGHQRLAKIGPAPDFTLTTQDGGRLSLKDLQGNVVVVTFIFASCADTCPLLTAKLAGLARRLGTDGGSPVRFVQVDSFPDIVSAGDKPWDLAIAQVTITRKRP